MDRTTTPAPFAEGARNADILVSASLPGLMLDYARTAGRFDEVVDTIREADSGLPRLRARAATLIAEMTRLRVAILAAGGDLEEWEDVPACERDLSRALSATTRALGLAS